MQNEHTNPFKLKSLYVISKVLAKLHHIKKQGEKEMAVEDLLNTLRFFQRYIADTTQRHQFLNVACDFMKFKFYTKGSAICHIGNPISNLSILIDGRIGLFVPKDPEELESINHDLRRNHVIEYYSDYIQEHKSREKVKSQTEIGVHGPVSPRKGKAYSLTQIKELGMAHPTSNGLAQRVLAQKNTIIPESLLESDISTEEKLLLLAHHDQLEKCIFEGELTMKSVGYLNVGDTFGEETLLKTVPAKYTMVAMEDVYLVSLSREDYTFLYSMPELVNTSEKIQFLAKIFPDLSREARMKLAFYLEERVYASREVIYREGVEADAIYMVKNGEVEYVTYEKPQKARSNTSNKLGPLAVPALKVGNLSSGTIFGEEEVVNMTIRKSSATAKQVNTFLYVLRKEVYHEMFAKHVPYIAGLFRDWIQIKKVLKGEVETEPIEWPIREKKSPIHSPRLVIKTTASPRDTSEPITERLKNKQNLLKIQSSIGIKAPTKMVPILDTNSIASPHYQEKRLKSLDFHRVNTNTLINLEQLNPQRIITEQQQQPVTERKQPVITSPALKSPKLSNINLKTLEDIQEQKSNLFIFNQKQIDAKRRGSMSPRTKIPASIKLVPLDKAASPFGSTSRNTDTGLASELKKNLLISMSGAQTSRTNEKDSATFESAVKNGSLNSIASSPIIKKSNPNSILNIGPLDQPIDQIRLNMNKISTDLGLKLELGNILTKTEGKLIKGSHRRVKTHLGSPVKLGLPLELEKLMMGPEKNASEGLSKRVFANPNRKGLTMIPPLKKSHTEANPPLTYDQKKQMKIKVLNKLGFKNTEEQQHAAVVDILGNSRFFQRFITNPKQRRELIEALAPYVEFEFFPRGTGVCYHGEIINKFSVAVKGRALVYSPKLKEELVETDDTSFRQEVLRTYINYYREELSLKKKPQVLPPSTVPVLKSSATCVEKTFKITSIEPIQEPLNKKKDAPTLLETVLATKPTIKGYLLQYDLSPEERLFLVANLENAEEYINLGDFDMKPTAYLDPGDTYNEVCLLRSGYSASTIVAVEDFCVISFTMQDFPVIYATVAGSNLREKKNFLDTLFPALSKDSRLKILYYLEERVVNKGEILYKEGDEANEFYMVKDGEIELLTHKHQYNNANSKHLDRKLALKISPNDRITIGTFHEGTILGEEDVINSTTRTTFAVARQLDTFIYVLKKKIYKEVFVAYFDHIASAFKDWVVVKDKWQKERVSAEQQFTYRRVNAQDKEGDNKRNDKSKYKKYGSSVSQDASPKKEEPIVLNTEEKEKLFRLKMNSSLSLKCVVRGKPPQMEESLASARYQERRTKNADPFMSHRQYSSVQRESSDFRQSRVKNQTPVDPSDIIETTRLFTPNANLIRQQKRIQSQIESNAKRETPSFRKTPFPSLDYMLGGDYSDMRSPSPLLKSTSNFNNMDQSRYLVRQESPFDYDGGQYNTPVKIKSYPINKQSFLLNQPSMPLLQIIKGVSQTSLEKEILKRKSDKIPTLIKLKRPGKHSRAISVPKSQTFFNIHPV